MEKDFDYIAFQLEQYEKKIASIEKILTFLNKLLITISVVIPLLYIYK